MFKNRFFSRYVAALLALAGSASAAAALTGEDVMTKMSDKESFAYISGSIEMAAFLAKADGADQKAACIIEWYFGDGNGGDQIDEALSHFKDRGAQAVMIALINRRCQ